MKKIVVVSLCCLCWTVILYAQNKTATPVNNDRKLWLNYLDKLAKPILSNLAQDKLKENMPVVLSPTIDSAAIRLPVAYLEAFGRVMSGIAPWLNGEGGSAEEIAMRNQYRQWSLQALANAVNPSAKDYLKWKGGQPLVDASFLALALVRCPWIWEHTTPAVRDQVVTAFKITRATVPSYSNWILFSAMIEVFFCRYDLEYDPVRIEYGIREFAQHWYVGDGVFSDGMQYHWDYYNSYVIQPYMSAIIEVMHQKKKAFEWYIPRFKRITRRYAVIQERLINTDGSFPATGRSIVYRGGAFQHLADMSLRKQLPDSFLTQAQVRGALTAVIKKTSEAPSTFTKDGWLNIGLYGSQPDIADRYITTGSLYLCATILLPLGLPDTDEFWTSPPAPWTSVKVWSGQRVTPDHALD